MRSLIRRKPRQKKSVRRTVPSVRPRLEALEDRCLLSAGSLDPTFGSGGTVATAVTKGSDSANGVLLQSNGDIIAYGTSDTNGRTTFDLVRYTPSGSLDSTFGSGGIVATSFKGSSNVSNQSAALQSDGKIVTLTPSSLSRYNSDGSLDNTFGQRGQVTLPSGPGWTGAVLVEPMSNGSEDIVILGVTTVGNDEAIALARYTPTGQLDTTFGTGGEAITDVGSGFWGPTSLALENGDIVVGGGTVANGTQDHLWLVARYTANGSLDTTFNPSGSHPGIVTTQVGRGNVPTQLNSLLVQPGDGKIVAVGQADNSASLESWGLVRYNSDGSLDSTFGNGGIVLSNLTPSGDHAVGSALQSNGEIVVDGWNFASPSQLEVGVYNSDGSPDTTFGTGGFVVQSFNSGSAAYGVAVQPADGKIVAAGSTTLSSGKSDFFLARYIGTTTSTITPAISTVVKPSDSASQPVLSTPPSSMPGANGSTQPADSVLPGMTSAPSIPITPANPSSAASPIASGWPAFQATVLGTLERKFSQLEDAIMQELASLTKTVDQLFTDWDQMIHDSFVAIRP